MTQSSHSQSVEDSVAHRIVIANLAVFFFLLTLALNVTANENNSGEAFGVLNDDERHNIEPALQQTHFKNGYPRLYRRHRVLKIDTETFRLQLLNDWTAREEGLRTNGVAIPLFEDQVISVEVDSWIDGGLGVTSGYGKPHNSDPFRGNFEAHFSNDGRLEASINIEGASFLISYVRDYEHYLILEMEPFDGPID